MGLRSGLYNLEKLRASSVGALMRNARYAYWWNEKVNFGDLLTPEIFSALGYTPIHRYPQFHNHNDTIAAGSLIQMLPQNYRGTVIGTGLIRDMRYSLPEAHIISVRGELTKKAMNLPQSLKTGDIGLISDTLLPAKTKQTHFIGVIPHYADKLNPWVIDFSRKFKDQVLLIDVQRAARKVVCDISRCGIIASSSLHGIIVSDSLRIPNLWIQLSNNVAGEGFKFHDYFSSLNEEQQPIPTLHLHTPNDIENRATLKDQSRIDEKKKSIKEILTQTL